MIRTSYHIRYDDGSHELTTDAEYADYMSRGRPDTRVTAATYEV